MAVQTQIQVRRGTASSWTSTNPTLAAGEIGFESDTGKIKVGTGSATWNSLTYIGAANAIQYVYNASAGQTTFSGADANGATLAYTVGAEQVYVNGVLQVRNTDYTATNGTSVVLTTATIASDIVTVVALGTFTVADTYTQAQANATFPLNSIDKSAGKNKIINGDFNINQRAFTSLSLSGAVAQYGFDRWRGTGQDGTVTYSAQTFTPGTAPVTGYESTNFARLVTSGQTAANALGVLGQPIEDVRSFANQTITVSFWAKAASGTPKIAVELDQQFGSGGSTRVTTYGGQVTLSTSWARYSVTVAVPSISGKTIGTGNFLALNLFVSGGSDVNARTGSLGIQSNTFDFWGVQLEAGSVATSFQTATGTIQGELAACQRYYIRYTANGNYVNPAGMQGFANSGGFYLSAVLPVSMRVAPTSVEYSGLTTYAAATNVFASGAAAIAIDNGPNSQNVAAVAVTNGTLSPTLSAGTFYKLIANNVSTAYLAFSAEL